MPWRRYMLRTDRAFVGDGSQEQTNQDLGVLFQYCGRQFCRHIFRTSKSGRSAGTPIVQLKHHRAHSMAVRCTHGKSIELTCSEHRPPPVPFCLSITTSSLMRTACRCDRISLSVPIFSIILLGTIHAQRLFDCSIVEAMN